ncbi:MAG: transcription termination factor NusA [Patescibacteria group bacterium]|nr:transcription termination factor NusA [Patescibacteria group bacterium]
MPSAITQAIKQICEEKNISYEAVLETIEAAMGAAYRKDFGNKMQNIRVNFDPETAGIKVFDVKEVVEDQEIEELEEGEAEAAEEPKGKEVKEKEEEKEKPVEPKEGEVAEGEEAKFNPKTQIMISDAKDIKADAKIGDEIRVELEVPGEFGRMAAQTAKQVITQKLREAERENVYKEYKDREGEVINAVVQRREGRIVLIDLGRISGIMRPEDQVPSEFYRPGERIKVFVAKVEMTTKGPEILLSRSHPEMVRRLFELEIPEIASGAVEIKAIAREAGSRTKVAVTTREENVDPIGSCIGQRGTRIQTIISELGGEKIDIIEWKEDAETFIMNSLSPAKTARVTLDQEGHSALVSVAPDQLSLAIGRGGQNVRLAARLTSWKINVAEEGGGVIADSEKGEIAAEAEKPAEEAAPVAEVKPAEEIAPVESKKKKEPKKKKVKKEKKEDKKEGKE